MVIINLSKTKLHINNNVLETGTKYKVDNKIFDTVDIHSNEGSAHIVTEYGIRHFSCYGNLIVMEDPVSRDIDGMPIINVLTKS